MKKLLKRLKYKLLKLFLNNSFSFFISKKLTQNTPKILVYHRFSNVDKKKFVSAKVLCEQLEYLKNNFFIIDIDDFYFRLKNKKKFPKNTILLTIDDGYSDCFDVAYPIFKRYKIHATLFIATAFINKKWLWHDLVELIFEKQKNSLIKATLDKEYTLKNTKEDKLFLSYFLKKLPHKKRQNKIKAILKENNISLEKNIKKEYQPLEISQLKTMQQGFFTIGSHTKNHTILTTQTTEEIFFELEKSKEFIQENINKTCNYFAYPNGMENDFNLTCQKALIKTGYKSAFAIKTKKNNLTNIYALPRYVVGGDDFYHFKKHIFGITHLKNQLKNKLKFL